MKTGVTIAAGITAAALCGGEMALAEYFYRRTMIRANTDVKRTMNMAGTDWDTHMPFIKEQKEWLLSQEKEDVYISSFDGLRLHGTFFPGKRGKKLVIGLHGYTGEGITNFIGVSRYYLERGYQLLLVDLRAHGKSEGTYIGFGTLDKLDTGRWIDCMVKRLGEDCQILLHGVSMGGATALMTGGQGMPPQVKGIISDCAFTSVKEVFTHVLKSMYHMPAFPLIDITDQLSRKRGGYGMDEGNAARDVEKITVPVLFIHGDADTFVPCSMGRTLYQRCGSQKEFLVIPGAGHAECYYKDRSAYEKALDSFTGGVIQ